MAFVACILVYMFICMYLCPSQIETKFETHIDTVLANSLHNFHWLIVSSSQFSLGEGGWVIIIFFTSTGKLWKYVGIIFCLANIQKLAFTSYLIVAIELVVFLVHMCLCLTGWLTNWQTWQKQYKIKHCLVKHSPQHPFTFRWSRVALHVFPYEFNRKNNLNFYPHTHTHRLSLSLSMLLSHHSHTTTSKLLLLFKKSSFLLWMAKMKSHYLYRSLFSASSFLLCFVLFCHSTRLCNNNKVEILPYKGIVSAMF